MDRQAALLLALGLLIAAAAFVSVSGWILFVRDRRAAGPPVTEPQAQAPPEGSIGLDTERPGQAHSAYDV